MRDASLEVLVQALEAVKETLGSTVRLQEYTDAVISYAIKDALTQLIEEIDSRNP